MILDKFIFSYSNPLNLDKSKLCRVSDGSFADSAGQDQTAQKVQSNLKSTLSDKDIFLEKKKKKNPKKLGNSNIWDFTIDIQVLL